MAENLGRRDIVGQIADENNNLFDYYPYSLFSFEEDETGVPMDSGQPLFMTLKIETVKFMRNMGIIRKSRYCIDCNEKMKWQRSGTIDMFEWVCAQCKKTSPIRQGSLLENISCRFEDFLEVLRAWCNNQEIDRTADKFGIEPSTVMKIFSIAGLAAEKHIEDHISDWRIGGQGVIVLIDTFPETHIGKNKQSNRPILCLAELKGFPMTVAYHPLQTDLSKYQDVDQMKSNCQSIIRKFVHPKSAVVARRDSFICSYEDICANQPQFSVLASNEGLLRHESLGRSLQNILSTIWEKAVYDCMSAQYYPDNLVQGFLFSHMWKNKFRNNAFPSIVEAIATLTSLN